MYRPENWKVTRENPPQNENIFEYIAGYEAGADAMLKGQLNSKDCFYTNSSQIKDFCKKHKGWLVFIPDEES